jgi:dephospho-CoA kinase
LAKMAPEEKAKALALLSSINIDLSKSKGDLTGTGVSGFIFYDILYEADSHKDAFLKLTQLIVRKFPDQVEVLLRIQGTSKKYFSKSVSDLKQNYEKIKGTDIYADTNESAVQLNRRCQKILQAFGVDPTTFIIIPG